LLCWTTDVLDIQRICLFNEFPQIPGKIAANLCLKLERIPPIVTSQSTCLIVKKRFVDANTKACGLTAKI
jgi:hypothetical protein